MSKHAKDRDAGVPVTKEASVPAQRGPAAAEQDAGGRPHLMTIAMGLFDARVSGVDFFDTVGGEEIKRIYRLRQGRRHHGGHPPGKHTAAKT